MTPFGIALFPMTDVGGGVFSLVVTAVFLRFWKPSKEWHFGRTPAEVQAAALQAAEAMAAHQRVHDPRRRGRGSVGGESGGRIEAPLTVGRIALAWAPFAIMSLLLLLSGLLRQEEGQRRRDKLGPVMIGPIQTSYMVTIPFLDGRVMRDPSLHDPKRGKQNPEKAEFEIPWLTSPGFPVFWAGLVSMLMFRMGPCAIYLAFRTTCMQMRVPIPTIALMLGLSYVTRYAGMDATVGVAFAYTGAMYPYFGTLLGWVGVFLTGTDAGSNALFGSLQKITATKVHQAGWLSQLSLGTGAGVNLCGEQHRRRYGQDDRRAKHRRVHGGDQSGRPRGGHLQGGPLAQLRTGVADGSDYAVSGVCLAVHADGAAFAEITGQSASVLVLMALWGRKHETNSQECAGSSSSIMVTEVQMKVFSLALLPQP